MIKSIVIKLSIITIFSLGIFSNTQASNSSLLGEEISQYRDKFGTKPVISKEYTEKDYEEFLDKESKNEPEALKVKENFKKLSKEKKNKCLYYINHPELIVKAIDTPLEENSSKTLFNGDITVSNENKVTKIKKNSDIDTDILSKITSFFINSAYAVGSSDDYHAEDIKTVIFGADVPLVKFKVWVKYKASNKKTVTSIISGNGNRSVFLPLTKVTKDSVNSFVFKNKAHTEVVWGISFPINAPVLDVSSMTICRQHHVIGFANGSSTYRYFLGT